MDNQNQKPDSQHMPNPLLDDTHPQSPTLQQRSGEKVIQPLTPGLTASEVTPKIVVTPHAVIADPTSTYDPTTSANSYRTPIRDLNEGNSIKTVAMKHKSLMVLAIVGLLNNLYGIYAAFQINHAIQQAQLMNTNGGETAQAGLDILYASIAINVFLYVYFLLAKNPHTVATILKIVLILEFITVFGVFWGGSSVRGVSLLIDGAYLLYTFIVFNIVKTPSV